MHGRAPHPEKHSMRAHTQITIQFTFAVHIPDVTTRCDTAGLQILHCATMVLQLRGLPRADLLTMAVYRLLPPQTLF